MPGFDERKIPTLDDVIEIDDNEKIDFNLSIDGDEISVSHSHHSEINLALFENETIDLVNKEFNIANSSIHVDATATTDAIIEGTINTETNPTIDTIDNLNNEDDGSNNASFHTLEDTKNEIDEFESALIDHNIATEAETLTINSLNLVDDPAHNQPVEREAQAATALSLQSITDDIVKQLMPELEQKLRLLLEQALKEKLPAETVYSQSAETSAPNN